MEAIYTTTGMMIKPYHTSAKIILMARSVWVEARHCKEPVTAFLVKDPQTGGKRLLTYKCGKKWLQEQIPDIVIRTMSPNNVNHLSQPFTLNEDVLPTELQVSATKAVLDNDFREAFFNIPTGLGKTLVAAYLTSILDVKTWAMCYRTEVLRQWQRTFAEMTTIDPDKVRIVSSSKELYKMAIGEIDPNKYDIFLSTPGILMSFAKQYGYEMVNEIFDQMGIGVKFFDEAHYNVGNITKINAVTNVPNTYYLSADFGQPDPAREKLYMKMFNFIPVIKPDEVTIKNMQYTIGVIVRYNTNPSSATVDSLFSRYGFVTDRFMEYQLNQDNFYHALSSVYDTILNAEIQANGSLRYKILVLMTMIDHVNFMQEWTKIYLEKYHPELGNIEVVRFHSRMPEAERQHAKQEGQIIISTYDSMGIGVDLKLVRHVISTAPINSINDNQAAGRARPLPNGEDCFYYIFCDDGVAYVRKHLPDRLDYLQQQKIKRLVSIKYS